VYPDRAEDRVLSTVVRKLEDIQRDLGSMGAVVMDDIALALEKGIGQLTLRAIEGIEAHARDLGKATEELESARRKTETLKAEVTRAQDTLDDSAETIGFDHRLLKETLDVALGLAGAKPLTPARGTDQEPDLPCFTLPALGSDWEATLDTVRTARLHGEPTWEWRKRPLLPVVFKPPKKLGTPVAHLHLAHPLVQRLLSRLFAQGYAAHDLSRVTVVRTDRDSRPRVLGFVRVSIFGHGAVRLHDDLLGVAGRFRDFDEALVVGTEKSDKKAVENIEQLLAEATALKSVAKDVRDKMAAAAPAHFAALWPHLQAEADAVLHDVERDLTRRGGEEASALARILDDQAIVGRRAIEANLAMDRAVLDADTRKQLDDEKAYLERRLAALPKERATEVAALKDHYRVLQRRVERVGLIYVWPETRG
jgi:hypothetical protein